MSEPTHFLNVDLDVVSRADLGPLAAALEPGAVALHLDRYRGRCRATFEVFRFQRAKTADGALHEFGRVLALLRGEPRRLFRAAEKRVFDIGIEAGREPHSFHEVVSKAAVKIAAALDAEIAVTVYAPFPRPKKRQASGAKGRAARRPQKSAAS